jgi:hypothetical protein
VPKIITARARVQVTLEFLVTDTWGDDCKVDQVYKQAAESAIGQLRRGCLVSVASALARDGEARVIGDPKVTAILVNKTDE